MGTLSKGYRCTVNEPFEPRDVGCGELLEDVQLEMGSPRGRLAHLQAFLGLGCCLVAGNACAGTTARSATYINQIRPDERPPGVGVRASANLLTLWGPLSESSRGDGISESRRAGLQVLVERFAPTIIMPINDNAKVAGKRYWMNPTNVSLYTDTLTLDLFRAAPLQAIGSTKVSLRTMSLDSLALLINGSRLYQSDPDTITTAFFDFPGHSAREWWQAYGRFRTGPDSARWAKPTVYAHPFILPDGARLAIQYWFFYPVNDFVGNHEGDWEHINVVMTEDHQSIAEVHYYFHHNSLILPQRSDSSEIVDKTHPVVHLGGRLYNILDYPIRLFGGEHNEGAHGTYPHAGEWEAVAGFGGTESVSRADKDSLRVVPWRKFDVVLTPEPSRIDYGAKPEVLREWAWLLLPVRWGDPVSTSLLSELNSDVGNRAAWGPAFGAAWNRTAPGLLYSGYAVRRVSRLQSYLEDLLQPWYYLYAFRSPRFINDIRDATDQKVLEDLRLLPRVGWGERGFGTTALGLSFAYPNGDFADQYATSKGYLLVKSLWGKLHFGPIELAGGYQRFEHQSDTPATLFVYPITGGLVFHPPRGRLRPYLGAGAGVYGWQSRVPTTTPRSYLASSGWSLGWNAQAGIEYYLRPRVALDVGVRLNDTHINSTSAGLSNDHLRFMSLWIGHYFRF